MPVVVVAAVLLLTGCLEVLQTVETRGDTVNSTIRVTFSKRMIDGGAAMSGEQPDYSDLPEISGEDGMVNIDLPGVRVETTTINSSSDIGEAISVAYPASAVASAAEADRFFLPVVSSNRIEITLPPNEDAGEIDDMTAIFFGGSRYRLLVDREGRPVRQVLVNGQRDTATITQVGTVAYVEFPLDVWMSSTAPVRIVLEF
jgi:hypothetical protein